MPRGQRKTLSYLDSGNVMLLGDTHAARAYGNTYTLEYVQEGRKLVTRDALELVEAMATIAPLRCWFADGDAEGTVYQAQVQVIELDVQQGKRKRRR